MTRDFTYRAYDALLDAATEAGYEFLPVREYLARARLPPRFLVLRHDVERKPENALDFARAEADRGVRGSYYFRTRPRAFEPEAIRHVESLGHEVGYHYEVVDRADGDVERARRLFEADLDRLRDLVTVETVCVRVNPLTPHDNLDLWDRSNPDFERHGLLGEATLSLDVGDVTAFSDGGLTWQNRPLVGDVHALERRLGRLEVDTTMDLIDLFRRRRVSRACLHVHPNQWADTYPELVAERTRDAAVKAARRGLELL